MRIGIVSTWFERGASYVSRQFMQILQKCGDEVFIYARAEEYAIGNPNWDLPNVTWGKRCESYQYAYGSHYIDRDDFKKWIDHNQIELVLFNEQKYFSILVWCKRWHVKTAAYIDYYTEETLPLYDVYDCLVCNTRRHAFAFRHNPNAVYLKWGTNVDLYRPTDEQHQQLTFFNSAGMAPYRKGTDFTIRAFHSLPNRKQAKLLIHTQVPLKKTIPDVAPLIDELTAEGSLEIVEKSIPAPGLYHRGDVYVYPSRLDGIGLTLMEAISSGMACITVDNPPMNEFIDSSFGVCCDIEYQWCRADGYYWPMCAVSIEKLATAMRDFVEGKYDVPSMKVKAREYALKELDFSHNCLQLHDILNQTRFHDTPSACEAIIARESTTTNKLRRYLYPIVRIHRAHKKE